MSRLRFLSSTSVALLAGAATAAGCGDDSCGPGGAPEVGLVASGDAVTFTYGQLHGGLNGDCPAAGAPAGVTSLTITGTAGGLVTLCVERPDLLARQAQALGPNVAGSAVHIVDLGGDANSCRFAIDPSQPVAGTASATGLCGNGADPAGFALVVDGSATLRRTCGSTIDAVPVTLHGRIAVAAN
jgi:hypothetical protein